MSTSTSTNPFTVGAQDDFYQVDAGDVYTARVIPGLVNEGVLANDLLTSFFTLGPFTIALTENPEIFQTYYGRWTLRPDGGFDYYANGALSKYLLENETGTDELDYIIPQLVTLAAPFSTAKVSMEITGKYDPLEVQFVGSEFYRFTEDTWKEQSSAGPISLSMPGVRIDYFEGVESPDFSANYTFATNIPETDTAAFQEFNKIYENLSTSGSLVNENSLNYYYPELNISKKDFDFLRPGYYVKIIFNLTITDGKTTLQSPYSYVEIEGVDHSLITTPDTAMVRMDSAISNGGVISVLINDSDPDSQGVLRVVAVSGGESDTKGLPPGQPATIVGDYGSLTMYSDGTYSYQPDRQYFSSVDSLVDRFFYLVTNNVDIPVQGQLDITLTPSPDAIFIEPLTTTSFTLNDHLMMEDTGTDMADGGTTITPLGTVAVKSINEMIPAAEISLSGFSVFSETQLTDLTARAALSELPSIICSSKSEPTQENDVWRSTFNLALRSSEDFQFLSPHDQIKLDYKIQFGQSDFMNDQTFSVIIEGDNEAPVAVADGNFVYAGRAVSATSSGDGVLGNDSDIDLGDQMHVSAIRFDGGSGSDPIISALSSDSPSPNDTLVIFGKYGKLLIYADGRYTYDTFEGYATLPIPPVSDAANPTIETFTYTVHDRFGGTAEQTLNIEVLGPSDKPTAVDDELIVDLEDLDLSEPVFNILDNDQDVDISRLVVADTVNLPDDYLELWENGDVYLNADALQALGEDEALDLTFFYTAGTDNGASNLATVHVHVIGSNAIPQAHDDVYFYENVDGSTFEVGRSDGMIFRVGVSTEMADSDIDGDLLWVSAVSLDNIDWVSVNDEWVAVSDQNLLAGGSTILTPTDGVTIAVRSDGSFSVDAQDGYTGPVMFYYKLSDGLSETEGSVHIDIGGPASLDDLLLINEISLQNGSVIRTIYTDNGAAPNRIAVGAASIELLNTSDEAISGSVLSSMMLEIVASDGSVTTVSLGELTGLTQDASGNALNRISIPAGGILMLYEPGSLGLGSWAVYGPHKSFVGGASGSYAGQAWQLGASTDEAMAINLVQDGTSIDFFAANGADTSELTGIIALGDRDQAENDLPGVPWAGEHVGLSSEEQYDGSMSSAADTVFGRTTFNDTDSEQDWAHYVFAARTIGHANTKLYRGAPKFVANPEDPSENLNPGQGLSFSTGQNKQTGSGSLDGGNGHDVLVGQEGSDTLFGDELDDWLQGGGGNDSLEGGSGGDWLYGGEGMDQLRGGSGADVFAFAAFGDSSDEYIDTILDFTAGDRIDLSAIDINQALPGDQAFAWGGAVQDRSQASTALGKVVYWLENGMTIVQADAVDNELAPLELILNGTHSLNAANFTL